MLRVVDAGAFNQFPDPRSSPVNEEQFNDLARGSVTVAEKKLQEFINQVNVKTGGGVTVEAADVLVADAQYVLGTM